MSPFLSSFKFGKDRQGIILKRIKVPFIQYHIVKPNMTVECLILLSGSWEASSSNIALETCYIDYCFS
jgi:hypothetical protein